MQIDLLVDWVGEGLVSAQARQTCQPVVELRFLFARQESLVPHLRNRGKFLEHVRKNCQTEKHVQNAKYALLIRLGRQIAVADRAKSDAHKVACHDDSITDILQNLVAVVVNAVSFFRFKIILSDKWMVSFEEQMGQILGRCIKNASNEESDQQGSHD